MTTPPQAGCVTVLGAGSWGTALAILLARGGRAARLWAHDARHAENMRHARRNTRFLPDAALPETLVVDDDIEAAVHGGGDILIAVPSHAFRQTLGAVTPFLRKDQRIAWGSKGMERESHKLLHVVAREILGHERPTAVVSGPTFAREVARGLPTAVTVASANPGFAAELAARLHDDTFRAYTSSDVIGVEVGGAVKNVLAIAAGIADGLNFGANTRAALITRGLAEISRLGVALGGEHDTFMGLAGLGDLVLTCTDDQSRNRRFGLALARGETPEQAKQTVGQVVEGALTVKVVNELARELRVEMPISEQVYRVVYENRDPHEAVHELLGRHQKAELN